MGAVLVQTNMELVDIMHIYIYYCNIIHIYNAMSNTPLLTASVIEPRVDQVEAIVCVKQC